MGTLVSSPTAMASFDAQINKKGLDLNRSIIGRDLGTEVAGPAADIRSGMLVTRDNTGYVQPATGLDVYGVAKWGKTPFGTSLKVDIPIVLNGVVASLTGFANITNVTVRSAPNMAGTVYVAGAGNDYTVVTVGGTITRTAGSTIPDGATVYVTLTFALIDADFQFDGKFFLHNQAADRSSPQDNRITVITDWSRLFTTEWVTGTGVVAGSTYTIAGATSKLYCDAAGRFTNVLGTDFVGRVYQVPTAQDPFMGITAGGNPTP